MIVAALPDVAVSMASNSHVNALSIGKKIARNAIGATDKRESGSLSSTLYGNANVSTVNKEANIKRVK